MTTIAMLFVAASQTFNLPIGLLSAVCFVESRHNVKAFVPNDGGSPSNGICQLKLSTAQQLGYKGTQKALRSPAINIYWSAAYLHYHLVRYDNDVINAVASYNAGTCRLDKRGQPRNLEYVRKVLAAWAEKK